MKCHILWHYIWACTVCQINPYRGPSIQVQRIIKIANNGRVYVSSRPPVKHKELNIYAFVSQTKLVVWASSDG